MNILLGIRIAFAGGRDSAIRVALMAGGVGTGITLMLLGLALPPAMQSRIDRYAWHRTTVASPATAPDPALWAPMTDFYRGREIVRVRVAALGPRPPVPPGLDRLPGPGEVFVSPELARLLPTVPDDQLRDRFPGRIVGTIRPDGLVSPVELAAVVGVAPDELRADSGAYPIRGIEQPGERFGNGPLLEFGIVTWTVLLLGPLVAFTAAVTGIGAVRRERRFATIRLAGATRWQTGLLAAVETVVATAGALALGWCGYLLGRSVMAGNLTFHGLPFFPDEIAVPGHQAVPVLVAVPLTTVTATLVALRRVQVAPLGAYRGVRRRPPRATRLIPLGAGILGMAMLIAQPPADDAPVDPVTGWLSVLTPLSILVGAVVAGPWVCMWIGRALAALSWNATTLVAARRIAADPRAASHAVVGMLVASFVGTSLALFMSGGPAWLQDRRSVLDPGVVAVDVRGVPEEALAPLRSDGAVVVRSGAGRTLVVPCGDLARVSSLTCPLPASLDPDVSPPLGLFDVSGFAEPAPGTERFAIRAIYVPTDGTPAAQERVRTTAARIAPSSRTLTGPDWAHDDELRLDGAGTGFQLTMAFFVLLAACNLTLATIAGTMERRRPLALLRAAGMRLADLRKTVLLEILAPLAVTLAIGTLSVVGTVPGLLGPGLLVAMGAMAVSAVVALVALPTMDAATRHHSVRFE